MEEVCKFVKRGSSAVGWRYSLPSCLGTTAGLRLAVEIVGSAESFEGFETIDPVVFEAVAAVAERSACLETIDRALFVELVVPFEEMGLTRLKETQFAP